MKNPVIDKRSQTWLNLKDYCEARLQMLREKNDASIDIEKTERIRGQITEIKMFLEIEKKQDEQLEEQPIKWLANGDQNHG